ncbi:killer toxin alpha beta [Colletotrichum incanum]|uniref:chitinase n=1 Tax=Colletotrichum incanum TaxID=1573173 RepID=A0A166QPD6_COLIC|nr:killer toxin alpha beta [Colletotrichum incanum]
MGPRRSLFFLFNLLAGSLAQNETLITKNETYPTEFKTDGFNSTEYKFDLGIKPLVPVGEIEATDPRGSPLVDGCPVLCNAVGPDPAKWTRIHDTDDLKNCEEPLLFDFNICNELSRYITVRACTVGNGPKKSSARRSSLTLPRVLSTRRSGQTVKPQAVEHANAPSNSCGAKKATVQASTLAGPSVLKGGDSAGDAMSHISTYLSNSTHCGSTIVFAKSNSTIVGAFVGAEVENQSAGRIIQTFRGSRNARTVGVFVAETVDSMSRAQEAMQSWASGRCVGIDAAWELAGNLTLGVFAADKSDNVTTIESRSDSLLQARADCTAIQVDSGDICAALASRCGIRGADFLKFNTKTDLCSKLIPKQWVCCSSGTLPDKKPKPDSDGTCATHKIIAKDGCFAIAENYGIKQDDIEKFNKKTWGWAGCSRLQPDQIICVSEGNTPMPLPIEGAACGPQKPGTKKPSGKFNGDDLAKLNQCPLKACCSGWGFCGTTVEFCTESPADTGAPGAFKAGTNGCISNCGTDIVNNDKAPASFSRVGYFQAYNGNRDCLRMDATEIESQFDGLTHVHFAFAGLTTDFNVNIASNVKDQFDKFNKLKPKFKKIISFGGWAESTEPATYQRYRDAVKPANRERFANNVMKFLDDHSLDGVDFDWEYPGAPDMPDIPKGEAVDAQNYLRFLTIMREKMGTGERTLSIALPASFWYLKPFPVDKMAEVLDYFIYMTYDLHGQWDHSNKFANPGCPTGNCLRSHVNLTETENALSMITKAGVPASKIFVGISSYGRSFRMTDPECDGPMCTFTGTPKISDAEPGQCTGTGGYNGTQGNGRTDWAAYMDDVTKANRVKWIKDLNFGGTTDWAIDLAGWFEGPPTLEDLEKKIDEVPSHCRNMALVKILYDRLEKAITEYNEVSKDYDDKFGWYAEWVKDAIDAQLDEFLAIGRGKGLKYMDCTWETRKNKGSGPCEEATLQYDLGLNPGPRQVVFKMRDEDGFYKALLEETGIQKEWIYWRDHAINDPCTVCGPLPTCPQQAQCSMNYYMRKNFPRRISDTGKIDVPNPKEIVDEAIPSIDKLRATF